MLMLPKSEAFDLLGDALYDDLCRSLAALAPESLELIDQLASSPDVDTFILGNVADTYLYFVRDGVLTREEALHRLQKLLHLATANSDFLDQVLFTLFYYSPVELRDEIQAIYQDSPDQEELNCWITWEEFEENFNNGQREFQKSLQKLPETGYSDCVSHLKKWSCFQPKPDPSPTVDEALGEVIAAYKENLGKIASVAAAPPLPQPPIASPPIISNSEARVGRNDPCPCGSGKKFKKCCRGKSND